jgi:hypothetical protein
LSVTDWLTDSLTNSCLVNLIDVTLACECQLKTCWGSYCYHVDTEGHVGNSLLQILKLRFGHEVKFCSDFEHRVGQDFEVEVQATFWSWSLFSIWRWCFVEVMKLNLGRDSEARFGQDFELLGYWRFLVDALSRFWRCDQDLCLNLWYDFKKLVWQDELNPRVRCAFGNV